VIELVVRYTGCKAQEMHQVLAKVL